VEVTAGAAALPTAARALRGGGTEAPGAAWAVVSLRGGRHRARVAPCLLQVPPGSLRPSEHPRPRCHCPQHNQRRRGRRALPGAACCWRAALASSERRRNTAAKDTASERMDHAGPRPGPGAARLQPPQEQRQGQPRRQPHPACCPPPRLLRTATGPACLPCLLLLCLALWRRRHLLGVRAGSGRPSCGPHIALGLRPRGGALVQGSLVLVLVVVAIAGGHGLVGVAVAICHGLGVPPVDRSSLLVPVVEMSGDTISLPEDELHVSPAAVRVHAPDPRLPLREMRRGLAALLVVLARGREAAAPAGTAPALPPAPPPGCRGSRVCSRRGGRRASGRPALA